MSTSNRPPRATLPKRLTFYMRYTLQFVTVDMWRLSNRDLNGRRGVLLNLLKVIYIAIEEFVAGKVSQKAAALTYTTLLSLVPFIAILLSVAAGFGMRESVQVQLYEYFPGHHTELTMALDFVQSYMRQIQGGVVIGVGAIILLYTVISLLGSIEDTFNEIWHISEHRSWNRRILGYLAACILLPLVMALSGGATLFISSLSDISLMGDISLTPFINTLLRIAPWVIISLVFTMLYKIMPNTYVSWSAAFISGILSGAIFQLFQTLYISGQIWVSKYNAIYGSFAAIPLLLLFIQLAWLICLWGVQLTYAIQNVERYAYKNEIEAVSRRFIDCVAITIMKKIGIAFKLQLPAYDLDRLARECNLPTSVVNIVLQLLLKTNFIIAHTPSKTTRQIVFLPNMALAQITVRQLLSAIDREGFEGFGMDIKNRYCAEWQVVIDSRSQMLTDDTLVIDL